MREKRWLLLLALYGILLAHAVSAALKTRPKFKIATTSTTTTTSTTEVPQEEENDQANSETTTVTIETNGTTGHTLTGIPQIDYIWDPNLPRELNGYNLSDYPFYNSIPEDIDFKCDGLHDGFYASVPHKCQVYHHCLFGTRYDFLCANFTAFDQKTFICHFVSEVDCANSKKYWHRNDALYQATTTTTTTTTTVAPVTVPTSRTSGRDRIPPRRRPPARRRPYDYYEEDYYDDEYDRSRDFIGRDDYEYDDRKYRRDRDREFRDRDRDRDFRDRDPPARGRDDRDRDTARDRYPARGNRRDPSRSRDPLEDDLRPRGRNPDQGIRSTSREVEDSDVYDRRPESRNRDTDERRYSDKRYRDDYDDKEPAAPSASASFNAEGLVKPAAPSISVYSRPRTPPKIRRPVPLSEQDKYAYKTTPAQPTEEPRRRPADLAEDDYYDDELEDIRPRRPLRRRPSYRDRDRDRDRDFYETRDRDRPLRTRYHSPPEEVRLRTHQDRSRDRYYDRDRDRNRDRALERGKDRSPERSSDRDSRGRSQDSERQERPYSSRVLDREREAERSRSSSRSKDLVDTTEASRRPNSNDRTTEKTTTTTTSTTTTTTTCLPEQLIHKPEEDSKDAVTDRSEKPSYPERPTRPIQTQSSRVVSDIEDYHRNLSENSQRLSQQVDYQDRDLEGRNEQNHQIAYPDEYSSEYYDEPLEEPPSPPPPRTTVRIVKRPFLPSRGGNPNPRGLSPVGSKAPQSSRRDEETTTDHQSTLGENDYRNYYVQDEQEDNRNFNHQASPLRSDNKQTYDAYKTVQSDLQKKQRQEEYDSAIARPALRKPIEKNNEEGVSRGPEDLSNPSKEYSTQNQSYDSRNHQIENLTPKWIENYSSEKHANVGNVQTSSGSPIRSKMRHPSIETTPNIYSSTYKNEDTQELPSGPGSYRAKQRINEVTHRLQDIPESEYDVTLNDALTPTLVQEANLPSGFVLPLHRQLGRDTVLQPSENNYKLSRPINQQQQQQHQQKSFIPNQFLPSVSNNDRSRAVYYRTPEAVQISGTQYRQQRPWQDYTAY
ncbi:PREDICTED: zinc finger CCCH domain-containing protein 13 [Atta colombica]|uniref:zinc finger CCCH domain-containing protein 13 n=1 Tax=Atta colombica TaxID=520822 RepID=UPI00084C8207|nr:PREDICTED: zinc finger CCCH domain-containing protein 13 [Atta colombica]